MGRGLVWDSETETEGFLEVDPEKVAVCRLWIEKYAKSRTYFSNRTSMGLMLDLENTPGFSRVSNGAFIQAAIDLGYKIRPRGEQYRSVNFNMFPAIRGRHINHNWALDSDQVLVDGHTPWDTPFRKANG